MSFKAFVWAWDQDVPNGDYHHVLLALANIAPAREVRASTAYISKQVRRSPRKVRAAILWLTEAGIITVNERPGKCDLIRLSVPANFQVFMPDEDEDLEAGTRGRPRKTPAPKAENPPQNPCTPYADEPIEPEDRTYLVLDARDPFEIWWQHYPQKKAKDSARLAFSRAMRRIEGTDPLQVLIDGVIRYVEEIDRTGILIKHPTTWLNGGCWNDEPAPNGSQTDGRKPNGVDYAAERNARHRDEYIAGAMEALDEHKRKIASRRRWTLGD